MPTTEPWSNLADISSHLQVSEDTVLRWIAKRHLVAHRVGLIWSFKLTEIDAWVSAGGSRLHSRSGVEQVQS